MPTSSKNIIYLHRAYRRIRRPRQAALVTLFSGLLIMEAIVYFSIPGLTHAISEWTRNILAASFPAGSIDILKEHFLSHDIFYVSLIGKYPSQNFSLVILLISLALIMIVSVSRLIKPLIITVNIFFIINIVSAMFFIFFPSRFPYDLATFSYLFMMTEVVTWQFILVMMGLSLYPFPASNLSKLTLTLAAVCMSIPFCMIRYIIFLYCVSKFSYLFIALFYFAFGTVMDILYIVGFFSLYTSNLSHKISKDMGTWKWS